MKTNTKYAGPAEKVRESERESEAELQLREVKLKTSSVTKQPASVSGPVPAKLAQGNSNSSKVQKKVKLSPYEAVEASRVVSCYGSPHCLDSRRGCQPHAPAALLPRKTVFLLLLLITGRVLNDG
jgi:hypothetical protein